MKVTVLNNDGSVVSTITVDDATGSNMRTREGTYAIGVVPDNFSDYWDGTQFVSIGEAPTQFHYFDYTVKQWIDAATIYDVRDEAVLRVRNEQQALLDAPVSFNGVLFDADSDALTSIQIAVTAGGAQQWIAYDNSIVNLTEDDVKSLLALIQARNSAIAVSVRKVLNRIDATEDVEETRRIKL